MSLAYLALVSVLISYILFTLYCFFDNLRHARSTGLPYVCVPFDELGLIVRYTRTIRAAVIQSLPFIGKIKWFPIEWLNQRWRWNSKAYWHERYGDAFITVSPGRLIFNVADPNMVGQVMGNRLTFLKPVYLYDILDLFGPSVLTTEGTDWSIHRRITTPPFKSPTLHPLIWSESRRLLSELLTLWDSVPPTSSFAVKSIRKDLGTLSLYTLSSAGFGIPLSISNAASPQHFPQAERFASDTPPKGHRLTYPQSLNMLAVHLQKIAFFAPWMLKIAPIKAWRMSAHAIGEFEMYIEELLSAKSVDLEADISPKGGAASRPQNSCGGDMLGVLLRSALEIKAPEFSGHKRLTKGLVKKEVMGNAFSLQLAGNETTANTLNMTLIHLALYPDKQDWLLSELDKALAKDPTLEFTAFENMSAIICTMYEVLRHFPPVPALPKWTAERSVPIVTSSGQQSFVPPGTVMMLSLAGLHHRRESWGECATGFHPEQWHTPSTSDGECKWASELTQGATVGNKAPYNEIRKPDGNVWLPFSTGGRSCLGRQFAEVEVAAVIASLLREYKVEIEPLGNETQERARERVREEVANSVLHINLRLRKEVGLRFVRRK